MSMFDRDALLCGSGYATENNADLAKHSRLLRRAIWQRHASKKCKVPTKHTFIYRRKLESPPVPAEQVQEVAPFDLRDVQNRALEATFRAWQGMVEARLAELPKSLRTGAAALPPATADELAQRLGLASDMSAILAMTEKLFGASASADIGEVYEPSLVVSVNVGANADVERSRQLENAWYAQVVELCPRAEGRVYLFVNYE
jgi:hypothetical protein